MRESIKQVLMRRDGHSSATADALIEAASEALEEYIAGGDMDGAENVCNEFFKLEPGYLDDLIY